MTLFHGLVSIGQWAQQHPQVVLGTFLGVPLLAGAVHVLTGGRQRRRETHGSARWGTYREVKRSGFSLTQGVVVGTMREQTFYDNGPTHVFLCAPTRSGKLVHHIRPTLLQGWRHSALILDPKRGEIHDETKAVRAQLGRVEAFAPYGPPQACINVCDTIRCGTLHEHGDALCIAQSLVAPYKMARENATSLHFRELAAMLLTAGLLHLGYTTKAPRTLQDGWRNDQARDCSERTIFANKGQACLRASLDILPERE